MSKYWNQRRSEVFKKANAIMRSNRREYSRHEALIMAWELNYCRPRPAFYVRCLLDDYFVYDEKHYRNISAACKRVNHLERKRTTSGIKDVEIVWNEEADKMLKMDEGYDF